MIYQFAGHYHNEFHFQEEMLIFMEFCAEGTLESLVVGSGNGLPEPLVRKYTHQLLLAVAVLHFHGIVHRDIKSSYPNNSFKGNSISAVLCLILQPFCFFRSGQYFSNERGKLSEAWRFW